MLALITATKNSIRTVEDALTSASPFEDKIKHILIDANSSDGTLEYLESFAATTKNSVLLSQIGSGLYPALNQGIRACLEDPDVTHIGFLHSDDRLIQSNFSTYISLVESTHSDIFYSDIEFHNSDNRQVRVWSAGEFSNFKLNTGWMPPHTSVIVVKNIYREFGDYDIKFSTAADYEWLVRILSAKSTSVFYFPQRTLTMLIGGASGVTLAARLQANAMDGKVWKNRSAAQSLLIRLSKPIRKVLQFRAFPQSTKRTDTGRT